MKWSRIRPRSGRRAIERGLAPLLLALAAGGCNYGFEGGGFPAHIRTIYIAPFENETPQFELEQKLFTQLLQELPAQLGVRPAGEQAADAILTGRITRYDDVAQSYRPGDSQQIPDVLSHEVQIAIAARLVDRRDNVIRWETGSMIGRGVYRPDSQDDDIGQQQAIENLIEQIIDGAQSQW